MKQPELYRLKSGGLAEHKYSGLVAESIFIMGLIILQYRGLFKVPVKRKEKKEAHCRRGPKEWYRSVWRTRELTLRSEYILRL